MRRTAYLKALEQASKLPDHIPELLRYFGREYSPKQNAIQHIMNLARLDKDLLFDSECLEVLQWKESDAQDNQSSINTSSQA